MRGAGTEGLQGGGVDRGIVALVAGEAVAGVFGIQRHHQPVPRRLGKDGGGGDRQGQAVALDNRLDRARQFEPVVAIYQGRGRRDRQRLDRTAHCQAGGAQDVELIDLFHRGEADAPGQGTGLDLDLQGLAPGVGQGLGVVDTGGQVVGIEDHRPRRDRPGPGPATCLVHAADGAAAGFDQQEFQRQRREAPRKFCLCRDVRWSGHLPPIARTGS